MKKVLQLLLVASIIFTLKGNVYAQAQSSQIKVGIVDVETILKEMPEAIEADKKIKDTGKKWQDTLQNMQKDLQSKVEAYQKQQAMMSADQKAKEEDQLRAQQNILVQYNDDKFGQQGELNRLREQLLQPIREKVKKAIDDVAKDEKITIVLDKVQTLFADPKLDITYRVLDKMKRGSN